MKPSKPFTEGYQAGLQDDYDNKYYDPDELNSFPGGKMTVNNETEYSSGWVDGQLDKIKLDKRKGQIVMEGCE